MFMKIAKRLNGASAMILSCVFSTTPSWSQDLGNAPEPSSDASSAGGVLMDEIVVTAQKREQNLQDVGIAITALSGEQVEALGMTTSVDVARMSSNVTVSGSFGGMMSQFTIRGVTQNDFNDHVESVIAAYVDETYIAMQQGQTFAMFDLERVEAMKGPQGTLFGRNATGGLVHFITRRPTKEFEGFVNATYGSYNQVRLEGALSGPITEGLSARLSGLFERADGWLKNVYPQETYVPPAQQPALGGPPAPGAGADLGGVKSNFAVRGQLLAQPSDRVQLWVAGFYNKFIGSSAPYQGIPSTVAIIDTAGNHINTIIASPTEVCEAIQNGACINGLFDHDLNAVREVPGASFFGYLDPNGEGRHTSQDYGFKNGSQFRTYGASGKVSVELGALNLTAISDYKDYWKHFFFDLDGTSVNQFFWISDSDEKTFSQELRLDGSTGALEWVIGAYYLNIDNQSVSGIGALPNSAFPINGWDQPRLVDLKTKSYSAFGQLEYKVSDTITLIGGVRATREKKDYGFEVLFVPVTAANDATEWDFEPAIPVPGFFQPRFEDKTAETLWLWKAQINYEPTRDLLLYAGVIQGAKAGSFNAGGPPLPESEIPYKSEKVISYETGFKSTLLGGRARLNASAYYYDYSNYQATRWTGVSGLMVNADAHFYGAEAELAAGLTNNLEMMLNVGWQKNKVKDVPLGIGIRRDVETPFAPDWTISGMLRYTLPQPIAGGNLAVQVDGNYQSAVWHNLNNFEANRLPGWAVFNARATWTSEDDRLRVSLFAQNVFDNNYATIGFDISQLSGNNLEAHGRPRWVGAELGV
ncbi:MAG: TonB-dependent receptor, partial [Alphaproteobacteria bacterium]|nr:TonB-dependent receptor [Alphaproteobacteria bacterium]